MKIYFLLLFNHVILQSKIPVRRFENRKDFDDIELRKLVKYELEE